MTGMKLCLAAMLVAPMIVAAEPTISGDVRILAGIEPGASTNVEAAEAARRLEGRGVDALVPIAEAIGHGNAFADNWLRGTFEAIAQTGVKDVRKELLNFYADRTNSARARRLVFETISANDPELSAELLASALDDPSEEMRFDAIQTLLEDIKDVKDGEKKKQLLRETLSAATVRSQVDEIANQLSNLGDEINKQSHFGFLTNWHVVGPFDNKEMAGFDVAYGPEKNDISAPALSDTFDGELGETTWVPVIAEGDSGLVDLAEQVGPHKGALVYATTSFESDGEQVVELRLSTSNAWKIWLNGQPLFEREEYHRGLLWDQYRVPATLRDGTNVIVIKVLQNEQDQSWAQRWSYSMRITDPTGRGVQELASN